MFKNRVKFVICKEDVISVIDTLSIYGDVKNICMKDGRHYLTSLRCNPNNMRKFMDDVFALIRRGVSIHAMDIFKWYQIWL